MEAPRLIDIFKALLLKDAVIYILASDFHARNIENTVFIKWINREIVINTLNSMESYIDLEGICQRKYFCISRRALLDV